VIRVTTDFISEFFSEPLTELMEEAYKRWR
jgi:hypothetical protein